MLRVGVFMGGKSVEKEASFNSGRTICDHLDTSRYQIIPLFQRTDGTIFILPWHFLHRGKTTDFEHRLQTEAQQVLWDDLSQHVDFMYLAIHGRYAEDGILQGFLEVLGIPYLGSGVLTSALCMDKIVQKKMLQAYGFQVPRGIIVTPEQIRNFAQEQTSIEHQLQGAHVTLPYIVKPEKEGSSLGVSVVLEPDQLQSALETACYIQSYQPQAVLVEEKIEGMEFSCITLVDYKTGALLPLPPTEIVPEPGTHFFGYDQKYMPGKYGKFTPARVEASSLELIQRTCIEVMQKFEITTISRIDGFLTPDRRVVIIEANTLAGMGPTSFLFRQAAEINMGHAALINHLIETELHAYGMGN
ncbi:MAG TPA: ATP-grasp domain-containing protein [Candidatus Limnocylindria bacterium]|nr:ATP-grasp domain-containing protein [Candidatus Limnocylindria bacterium]